MAETFSLDQTEALGRENRDHTRAALEFVHALLRGSVTTPPAGAGLFRELARAFGADAAGFAVQAEDTVAVKLRARADGQDARPAGGPWEERPELLTQARHSPIAVEARNADGRSWLLASVWAPVNGGWLLWVEAEPARAWSHGEAAALPLVGQALARLAETPAGQATDWTRCLERARLQERLENAAKITGKLAHDFGNVLTGILGFAELSLNQLPPDSLPHRYVQEVWQSAQQGAQWIQKLQQFSRRRAAAAPPAALPAVLAHEEARVRAAWGTDVALHVSLPADLPPVAVEMEALRQALAQLLDNAREAVSGKGVVAVSARRMELDAADCGELLGAAEPGPHVEVTVTDTGAGLSPEARGRLFHDLFLSTKVRRRGLGLAVVYGILQTYRGALRFGPDPAQGTAVRLFLPAAAVPRGVAGPAARSEGPRVLLVDDDPLVLRFMSAVLEGAGYRTHATSGAAEALTACAAARGEPFRLVLADASLPQMNGFELAQRLRGHDPDVNVLLIGSEGLPAAARDEEPGRFPLLAKPFRAEALLQAVRTALEQGRAPAGAGVVAKACR